MATQSDFDKFLHNINPSPTTIEYISSVQNNLRDYLKNHEKYKEVYSETFLSGSYAKKTSIRPALGDKKRDVDIVVVTKYGSSKNSKDVLDELKNVLLEKDIYKTATIQSHSVGIEMGSVSVDVVPVIADENDDQLYYVSNSSDGTWTLTDPKGHKLWSTTVNQDHNNKYKPLVKIFKWWRRKNCTEDKKYPKGITLEKIIADNLGDSSLSTEDFLIETIQNIISKYKEDYVEKGENPVIDDPSDKIEDNDLLKGYSLDDFSSFIDKLQEHADLLNDEGTENATWRKILGTEFPNKETQSKFEICTNDSMRCLVVPHRQRPLWPIQRGGAAFISVQVVDVNGNKIEYHNNGDALPKYCKLLFKACTGVKPPYSVKWQVVNTGYEAASKLCLRGGFESSNHSGTERLEFTEYAGSHFVQCYIIKNGVCVARSKEFIINIQ